MPGSGLKRWQARLDAVAAARRAYAHALHLRPTAGAAWGDTAVTLYQEAQLRRASEAFEPRRAESLRPTAERLVRGTPFRMPLPAVQPAAITMIELFHLHDESITLSGIHQLMHMSRYSHLMTAI